MSSVELATLEHFQEYRVELRGLKPVVLGRLSTGDWADITHLRINFSNLSFLAEDSQEFLDSDYRIKAQGLILRLMFFIECFELKYQGTLIWRYFEEDDFGFPVGLLLNYEHNSLSLLFKNERIKPLNIRSLNLSSRINNGKSVTCRFRRAMDLCANPKTDSLNSEFKTDKDQFKELEEFGKDKIPVWNADGDSQPTSVVHDKKNNIITIKFDDKVIICKKELGEWTRTTIWIPKELLILGENEEINSTKYDLTAEGDFFLLSFRNRLTLSAIKHNKKTLWKRLPGRPQPLSLLYKRNKRIIFRFEDVLIACNLENGRWSQRRFKLPPIRLCDMSFFSTVSEIELSDYNVLLEPFNGFTFNLKPSSNISLIAYGSKVIWKLKPDEMVPTAVTCYPDDGLIYLYYEKQFFVHIKDSTGNWSEYV